MISQFSVSQVLRDHLQWWTNFSSLKEGPLLHQKEHNLLLFIDAFFKGWDVQLWHQTASGIMKSQDSTVTGLLALESFGSQILNLNLLISTGNSSVVVYLNKQGGTHSQRGVPLSEESYLGRMPGGFRFGQITNVLADSLSIRDWVI